MSIKNKQAATGRPADVNHLRQHYILLLTNSIKKIWSKIMIALSLHREVTKCTVYAHTHSKVVENSDVNFFCFEWTYTVCPGAFTASPNFYADVEEA